MNIKTISTYAIVALTVAGLAACGGSSGGGAAATPTGTTASADSLTSVPTTDLSAYDTTTAASASLSAPLTKSLTAKEVPGAQGAGKLCRACCEAHMQKKQIFRSSVMAQQMRCYAEAFQAAGLITVPSDTRNIYSITPPEESAGDNHKKCLDIPADHTDEVAACQSGDEGGKKGVLMRLGVFGGSELQVDICKLKPTPVLQDEGTYSLVNGTATTDVYHIGVFGGGNEKMYLHSTITGVTTLDSDLVPTLSDSGIADATATMDSKFGSGTIHFKRTEADKSITVSGKFVGIVPALGTIPESTFTGLAYAKGGGAGTTKTVAAKFDFTGAPPPMPLSKMIPFDIPAAQLPNFLQVMSTQFGFIVNAQNYTTLFVCPNNDFKPETAANHPEIKPMVLAAADKTCPTIHHTGTECGTITNGSEDSGFTGKKITQTFATIDCTDASVTAFKTEVDAFDLSTLTASSTPIAFPRDWDCSGTATALDFSTLTEAQGTTLRDYMKKCNALEEKGRGNDGMGGYDCGSKDGAQAAKDLAGAPPNNGALGGPYSKVAGGSCQSANVTLPDKFFVAPVNPSANTYCVPNNNGACQQFTATGAPIPVSFTFKNGDTTLNITQLSFIGTNPTTGLAVTWSNGQGSCDQPYTKDDLQDFSARPAPTAGKADDFPAECVARGLTTAATCGDYCHSHTCSAPTHHE